MWNFGVAVPCAPLTSSNASVLACYYNDFYEIPETTYKSTPELGLN